MKHADILRRIVLFLSTSDVARNLLTRAPLTRSLSSRFVAGETVSALVPAVEAANAEGLKVTANYLGESLNDETSARVAADTYIDLLERIAERGLDANVSLKFTQLGQGISDHVLKRHLGRVLERAHAHGVFVRFDMESSSYTQRTLNAFEESWDGGWRGIGVVLQAYLKRTAGDVARMNHLGARVRLCKGAYAETGDVALQSMEAIREEFIALMHTLLEKGNYPAIATHDELLIKATSDHAKAAGIDKNSFEFQMLYGVRRDLQRQLLAQDFNVRVYIPFGKMWYSYLMRRLAERPENISFLVDSVIRESRGKPDHIGSRSGVGK